MLAATDAFFEQANLPSKYLAMLIPLLASLIGQPTGLLTAEQVIAISRISFLCIAGFNVAEAVVNVMAKWNKGNNARLAVDEAATTSSEILALGGGYWAMENFVISETFVPALVFGTIATTAPLFAATHKANGVAGGYLLNTVGGAWKKMTGVTISALQSSNVSVENLEIAYKGEPDIQE